MASLRLWQPTALRQLAPMLHSGRCHIMLSFPCAKSAYLRRGLSSTFSDHLLLARLVGQYCFACWRLSASSVIVCNTDGGPGTWAVGRPTLHGGPVQLRPVRATPCLNIFWGSSVFEMLIFLWIIDSG